MLRAEKLHSKATVIMCAVTAASIAATVAGAGMTRWPAPSPAAGLVRAHVAEAHNPATTPIRHLVVIYQENVSFDHYFGTYPSARNPAGEPPFHAAPGTPTVNGLGYALLHDNPNLSNPQRLDRSQAVTCGQNHKYTPEQNAFDHGLMDMFVQATGNRKHQTVAECTGIASGTSPNYTVMDYYDGNTVTALWNYAQRFAMSDNAFGSAFGPSSPGALELAAGSTYGALCGPASETYHDPACSAPPGLNSMDVANSRLTVTAPTSANPNGTVPVSSQPPAGAGTDFGDGAPTYDICSYLPPADGGKGDTPADTITMGGNNIGEELTRANISWGWFQGGFADGYVPGHGTPPTTAQICSESHANIAGHTSRDFIPHHDPLQYWASTANPMHLPPTSVAAIGHTDQANHQYGMADFWAATGRGDMPAVSYLKAPGYEDGHPGVKKSDPLDGQHWLASTIDRLQTLPAWKSTAVIITYDDSGGWYDQVMSPILTQSQTGLDSLSGPGQCGDSASQVPVGSSGQPEQARCGLGPRLPFLVISPYAKKDFVDSQLISQSSIIRFIEDNWGLPRIGDGSTDATAGSIAPMFDFSHRDMKRLYLSPLSGERIRSLPGDWAVYAGAKPGAAARSGRRKPAGLEGPATASRPIVMPRR